MRVAILALEGSVLSAISGLTDIFWITNKAVAGSPAYAAKFPQAPFETVIVSADGAPVWDAEGRLIHIDSSFKAAGKIDVVIAPGMLLGQDLQPLNIENIRQAADWFRQLYANGTLIATTGTGCVIAGEAGLLRGRSYTTTWWVSHMLQERYPDASQIRGKMIVEDRRVISTGGCFSWISLALHIIEKGAGGDVANLASKMSLTDNHYLHHHLPASSATLQSGTLFINRAQEIVRFKNPSITAAQLASALHVTERTLQRRMKVLSQETPKEFITRIRIESACTMLVSTSVSIRQVAIDCGYSEDTAFRKAFNQIMDMTPAQYRQWMAHESPKRTM